MTERKVMIRLQWAGHVGRMAEELDREKGDEQITVGRTRRKDGRGA